MSVTQTCQNSSVDIRQFGRQIETEKEKEREGERDEQVRTSINNEAQLGARPNSRSALTL